MNSSVRPSCIILGRKWLIIIKSLLKLGLLVLLSTCFYEETISYRVDGGSTGAGGGSSADSSNYWPVQFGSVSGEYGRGITSDSSGNVYIGGYTDGGLDGNTNSGSTDLFVIKYNSSGVKQWTQQLGSSSADSGRDITSDSSGNAYVTGVTAGGLDGNTSTGGNDLIVVKYNSSGTKQWTQQLGSSSADEANAITSDSSGNVYVTGHTAGGLDGNTSSGGNDLIVVKYNSSGTKQWTQQLGSASSDIGWGIAADSSGNVYETGYTGGGFDGNTSAG